MAGAKCEETVKNQIVLDFLSRILYYIKCQEMREQQRKSHKTVQTRLAGCEETVNLKKFLTSKKPSCKMVNVRGKAKGNPTKQKEVRLWLTRR